MQNKPIPILLLLACAVAVGAAHTSADSDDRRSSALANGTEDLQGTWTLKSYHVNGEQHRGEDAKCTFAFAGNTWRATWLIIDRVDGPTQVEEGTIKVVDGGAQRVLDFIHSAGKYKGSTIRAFVQVKEDELSYVQAIFPGSPARGAMDVKKLTTLHAVYRRLAPAKETRPPATLKNWRVARSFEFNGVDEFVTVPDHESLRFSAFTIAAWVRTDDATLTQPIVGKAEAQGNCMSYMLRIQDGGKLSLVIGNAPDATDVHWRTKASLRSGKWHHVAATWRNERGDQSDAVLYIDGVAQETELTRKGKYSIGYRIGYSAEPLYIGSDEFPSGYFKGLIEDLDLTGSVLSAESIRKQMQKRAARHGDLNIRQTAEASP